MHQRVDNSESKRTHGVWRTILFDEQSNEQKIPAAHRGEILRQFV